MNNMKNWLAVFFVFILMSSCRKDEANIPDDLYNSWEVENFISIESMSYAKDNNYSPVITFKKDNTFNVKLDVNNCGGSFSVSGNNGIKISALFCTEICCDSDFSTKFVSKLSEVESYSIEGESLILNVRGWGMINLKRN